MLPRDTSSGSEEDTTCVDWTVGSIFVGSRARTGEQCDIRCTIRCWYGPLSPVKSAGLTRAKLIVEECFRPRRTAAVPIYRFSACGYDMGVLCSRSLSFRGAKMCAPKTLRVFDLHCCDAPYDTSYVTTIAFSMGYGR